MRRLGLLLVLAALPALGASRFALVIGNNEGAAGRPKLWYAERDAERFARTLTELGEFPRENVRVLKGRDADEARAQLAALETAIGHAHEAGERTLLVVYFSGHAQSDGIELGEGRIGFRELRDAVEHSAADVRVAIVDACESGSLTQVKGARADSALDFALPAEDAAQGVAYLASTAVGEAAQESASIGGSFFTFHLEAALRGAGDADGDGQVTLAEAFRYTSSRTIAGTASSGPGPQHPTYDFKMSGRGDVVLSTLRRADAHLLLPSKPAGSYVISSEGALVAEAPAGTALALPAGHYRIERRAGSERSAGELTLARGDSLGLPTLEKVTEVAVNAKGGAELLQLYAGPQAGSSRLSGGAGAFGLRFGTRVPLGALAARVRFDYAYGPGDDRGLKYDLHSGLLAGALVYPVARGGVVLDVGVEVGGGFDEQLLATRSYSSPEGVFGGLVALDVPVGSFSLGLQLGGGARALPVNQRWTLQPRFEAALLVSFGI